MRIYQFITDNVDFIAEDMGRQKNPLIKNNHKQDDSFNLQCLFVTVISLIIKIDIMFVIGNQ